MSTGADCRFIQAADGTWTYELQNWPYGHSYSYTTHGPFTLFDDAEKHLHDHHANPGGFSRRPHPDVTCPHDSLVMLDGAYFPHPQWKHIERHTHYCRRCGERLVR